MQSRESWLSSQQFLVRMQHFRDDQDQGDSSTAWFYRGMVGNDQPNSRKSNLKEGASALRLDERISLSRCLGPDLPVQETWIRFQRPQAEFCLLAAPHRFIAEPGRLAKTKTAG